MVINLKTTTEEIEKQLKEQSITTAKQSAILNYVENIAKDVDLMFKVDEANDNIELSMVGIKSENRYIPAKNESYIYDILRSLDKAGRHDYLRVLLTYIEILMSPPGSKYKIEASVVDDGKTILLDTSDIITRENLIVEWDNIDQSYKQYVPEIYKNKPITFSIEPA